MNCRSFKTTLVATALSSAFALTPFAPIANGGVISISPSNVTASSSLGNNGFNRVPAHVVDGSGMHPNIVPGQPDTAESGTPDSTMWLTDGPNGNPAVPLDPNPFFQFNLGSAFSISSFHIWNYNEVNLVSRGVQSVDVEYTTDGTDPSTSSSSFNIIVPAATGNDAYTGTDFGASPDLVTFAPFTASKIRFKINNNYGSTEYFGLSEVRFSGDPATTTPEPASLAFLGLGAVTLLRKRRGN